MPNEQIITFLAQQFQKPFAHKHFQNRSKLAKWANNFKQIHAEGVTILSN